MLRMLIVSSALSKIKAPRKNGALLKTTVIYHKPSTEYDHAKIGDCSSKLLHNTVDKLHLSHIVIWCSQIEIGKIFDCLRLVVKVIAFNASFGLRVER